MSFVKEISTWLFSEKGYDIGLLILRVVVAAMMMTHGWAKIQNYSELSQNFADPIGLGPKLSLMLIIFAEFFCALLLLFGFFTKLAVLPLIVGMVVAAFFTFPNFEFGKSEMALLYLSAFVALFFMGAGKYSLDHLMSRWFL